MLFAAEDPDIEDRNVSDDFKPSKKALNHEMIFAFICFAIAIILAVVTVAKKNSEKDVSTEPIQSATAAAARQTATEQPQSTTESAAQRTSTESVKSTTAAEKSSASTTVTEKKTAATEKKTTKGFSADIVSPYKKNPRVTTTARSSKSTRPSTTKPDPYDVYDYYDAEDFYYDHYDDFYDYYDAEDYFNDHH